MACGCKGKSKAGKAASMATVAQVAQKQAIKFNTQKVVNQMIGGITRENAQNVDLNRYKSELAELKK